MEFDEIFSVSKEKTVLDQDDPARLPLEPRMILKQLMWKYEQIQFFTPNLTTEWSVRWNRVTQTKLNRLS